nr:hypothetical protein [Tanacetum cinerariifolium]
GFLHADWGHLLFNMITFYSFGGLALSAFAYTLGDTMGIVAFLALYLGGIVVSDLPTYFRHRHDPGYRSLGASGGVASVLFAGILFQPIGKVRRYLSSRMPRTKRTFFHKLPLSDEISPLFHRTPTITSHPTAASVAAHCQLQPLQRRR